MSLADRPAAVTSPALLPGRQAIAPLVGPLFVSLAYFLGAESAFHIGTLSDKIFAPFWPPNVILCCALLLAPQRRWWLYIVAAVPAHVISEHGVGMPLPQMAVAFATNCMAALLNAYAVRRLVGEPPWFGSFQKAALYIVIMAGPCPAVVALGGAFVPIMGGGAISNFWLYWSQWYLANVLPNLTLGPVFLIWFSGGAAWSRWAPSRRQIEPLLLALGLIAICFVISTMAGRLSETGYGPVLLLAPLPFVLWITVRYGEKGASGAILIVTVILTWQTLHDPALFVGHDPEHSVLGLQLSLMALAVPILLLGVVIAELHRVERTTRNLAVSLVTAQDDERRRIARDLHDSTGQNLIAATLIVGQIQKLLPPAADRILEQLEDVLQQAIREIRTVSYLLHPPLLDDAGLDLALRDYVKGYVERSEIKVDLNVAADIGRLPANMELVLFRIVQESLANVAKHSSSATALIRLRRQNVDNRQSVILTIADAGRGMPLPDRLRVPDGIGRLNGMAGGIGLVSMRERVHQVGGYLDILSTRAGTTVRAVIPLAAIER